MLLNFVPHFIILLLQTLSVESVSKDEIFRSASELPKAKGQGADLSGVGNKPGSVIPGKAVFGKDIDKVDLDKAEKVKGDILRGPMTARQIERETGRETVDNVLRTIMTFPEGEDDGKGKLTLT